MRILITGICGFVGSTLARALHASGRGYEITGFDNYIRPGSETNRAPLEALGIRVIVASGEGQPLDQARPELRDPGLVALVEYRGHAGDAAAFRDKLVKALLKSATETQEVA